MKLTLPIIRYICTWRFAANFLCRGNRQIGTHLPRQKRQKRQSQNTKKDLFLGLFQRIKCIYLLSFQLGHIFS